MQADFLEVLEAYTIKNRLRRIWRKLVQIMACVVVFCTTYALILPAITQESDLFCGAAEHTHTDACYAQGDETALTCGMEAHSHTLICHSDPRADLETREIWEQSVAFVELTGVWNEDVVSIARTQRGYVESSRNYIVPEGETTKGYTRYGAWYGDPYGDWAAAFASFCLHYAGVEDMPVGSDVIGWIAELTAADLFRSQGSDVPRAGELVFFDLDADGAADHVGIITEVVTGQEGSVPRISTIEGDATNRVQELSYSLDDPRISGYGQLPVQLTDAERKAVNLVIAKIDALPDAAQIDAAAEDEACCQRIAEAYHRYSGLNDAQKKKVTNADKLMALEPIWSVTTYLEYNTIDSEPVTITQSAHTSDLVELNIYDYDGPFRVEDGWNGDSAGTITDEVGQTGFVGAAEGTKTLSDRLGPDGYPYLVHSGGSMETDDPSLSCLFGEAPAGEFAVRKNTKSIDGLFQRDPISGEYFYNSRWNHAQYDEAASAFRLYDQIVTPDFMRYPFGNFLPFHDITDEHNAAQVDAFNYPGGVRDYILANLSALDDLNTASRGEDQSVIQLIRMMEACRAAWEADGRWDVLTAAQVLNDVFTEADRTRETQLLRELYNIDYDVEKNFSFGMEMKMTFLQAKDGLTGFDNGSNETGVWEKGRDKNGDILAAEDDTMIRTGTKDGKADYPMVFSFTGSDVWVYVDGIRFLDLSGARHHTSGRIDFEKGMVCYDMSDPASAGSPEDDAYTTQSFRDILTRYGGIAEEDLGKYLKQDESGNFTTFHDYSVHTLNFYYVERSSGSAVCDLRFNLPLLQKNSITVSNEVSAEAGGKLADTVLGDPDYYFNMITVDGALFVGPGSVTGVTEYKLRGSDGNILKNDDGTDKVFTTDPYGIFVLKAGQTAVFEGIGADHGAFFVQELIPAEDNGQYPDVFVNDRKTQVNELIDWSCRTYFLAEETAEAVLAGPYGRQWYGRYGSVEENGSAYVFNHDNRVDPEKLGALSITAEPVGTETDRAFRMALLLDGEEIPEGTTYTVGSEERTVTENGIVSIRPGDTATISGILSGTAFELRQVDTDGYTVSYASDTDPTGLAVQNDAVAGVIHAQQNVGISVANTENGADVRIPVTAALVNGDGTARSFTFILEQVTDSTGAAVLEGGTVMEQTVEIAAEPASFYFDLPYLAAEMETLPATFFYRITEAGEEEACLDNTQQFVAEVRIEAAEDGIQATLAGINGSAELTEAEFCNTLVGSLTLKHTVNGDAAHKAQVFEFEIELTAPGNVELPEQIQALRTAADGTQTVLTLQPENGVIRISDLANGEAVVFTGIPAGTKWSINQDYIFEFITTTRMGDTAAEGRAVTGTIAAGNTVVDYTNTQTYALPKTGGTGTSQYTTAGWMLLLCSAAYLMYNPAKRRKGDYMNP